MIEWKREDDGTDPKHAKLDAGEEIPAQPGPRRHLPGRQDPFDRLSGQVALRARDRRQSRQDQPHQHRPEVRRGAPDDAAAGDVSALRSQPFSVMAGLVPAISFWNARAQTKRDAGSSPGMTRRGSCRNTTLQAARSARRQSHAVRWPRAGADRSARGADLLAQSSAVGALHAAAAGWSCASRVWCRAATPASCCATTATAWSSARPTFSPRAGYTDISYLQGGIAAWEKAGLELFSGVNVPSKAFGEHIEHACHTPSVSARRARRA